MQIDLLDGCHHIIGWNWCIIIIICIGTLHIFFAYIAYFNVCRNVDWGSLFFLLQESSSSGSGSCSSQDTDISLPGALISSNADPSKGIYNRLFMHWPHLVSMKQKKKLTVPRFRFYVNICQQYEPLPLQSLMQTGFRPHFRLKHWSLLSLSLWRTTSSATIWTAT